MHAGRGGERTGAVSVGWTDSASDAHHAGGGHGLLEVRGWIVWMRHAGLRGDGTLPAST